MKKKQLSYDYSGEGIKASIMRAATSIRLQEGWAKQISEKVETAISAWILNHETISETELRYAIADELDKYSDDLAFAYRNHDKII